jgi:hypothetical protein
MSISTLPKELILMVTDWLPLLAIEALALTFNKQITPIVVSQLKLLFVRRRNKAHFEDIFGSFRARPIRYGTIYLDENEHINRGDLEEPAFRSLMHIPKNMELVPRHTFDPISALDYLDLKEDLHWLKALDAKTKEDQSSHLQSKAINEEDLKELLAAAEKANIKLPPSVIQLATHQDLLDHIPGGGSTFSIGTLRRVPSTVDKKNGGYIFSFYVDQQCCGFWSLYIEPGSAGRHCVLATPDDVGYYVTGYTYDNDEEAGWEQSSATPEERLEASKEGEKMARMKVHEASFEGLDFESWLGMIYFESWLWRSVQGEVEIGEALEPLREYVRINYFRERTPPAVRKEIE